MTDKICTWPSCEHTSRLQCMGGAADRVDAVEAYHLGLTSEQYDRLEPILRAEAEASIAANSARKTDDYWIDIFAAEAMGSLIPLGDFRTASSTKLHVAEIARAAFDIADAMVAERVARRAAK